MKQCEALKYTICKEGQCCFECDKRGECFEFNGVCNGFTKEDYQECEE